MTTVLFAAKSPDLFDQMPMLINSYLACHLLNLDAADHATGPFVIVQEAYDPLDELAITTLFLLRRDGTWVDEVAQSNLPEERRFLVLFDSSAEAAIALEKLSGDPVIERHPATVAELRTRLSDLKAGMLTTRIAALVEHYRQWKRTAPR